MKLFLDKLLVKQDLTEEEMTNVMKSLMTGQATDSQIAAILIALRMKGETITEITAAAKVMRELASGVVVADTTKLIDTCGTGGDGSNTFNISTASAFVVAGAGATVAKHGNRSISSKSGSADVLEAAGVNLELSAPQVTEVIAQTGVGFMFAPAHHSAMKHVIGVRKELAVRTVFNLLGPLTNPAKAPFQVVGVYDKSLLKPFAKVLQNLGSKHVMVVYAAVGLDEVSITGKTFVAELKNNEIFEWQINPMDFAMDYKNLDSLAVSSAAESLNIIQQAFANQAGGALDIICLNAGAAIYVAGLALNYSQGVAMAKEVISSGKALSTMNDFITATKQF
jgi:anthranilate phosphoribosyltransferase